MKIDGGTSMTGLQQMAAKAQEVRKPAGVTEPKAKDIPASSAESSTATVTPPVGKKLSSATGAVQAEQKPDHATGLDRAIERLQLNAIKNPETAGLQNALEMLQRNQERGSTVDTQA